MRKIKLPMLVIAVVLVSLEIDSSFAVGTSQHLWGTSYLNWQGDISGRYISEPRLFITQDVTVHNKASKTFWASGWFWKGQSNGAYLGLQTSGSLNFNGDSQEIAILSVWNSTTGRATSTQSVCKPFWGEGVGFSCRYPISIETGRTYRLKSSTYADAEGHWISASVEVIGTNREFELGSILLPKRDLVATNIYNFIEYFGEQRLCNEVETATAMFGSPSVGDGRGLGFWSFSTPQNACVNAAADSPPQGTSASVLFRFGGASQQPSTITTTTTTTTLPPATTTTTTTTTTTLPPATTTTLPIRSITGKRCQRVGAVRRLGNKTYVCKKTSKQLTWRTQT